MAKTQNTRRSNADKDTDQKNSFTAGENVEWYSDTERQSGGFLYN